MEGQRDAKKCQEAKPKAVDELKKLYAAYGEESRRLNWEMVEELHPFYLLHKEEAERSKDDAKAKSLHRWHVEEMKRIAAKYNTMGRRRHELIVKRVAMFKEIQALQSRNEEQLST